MALIKTRLLSPDEAIHRKIRKEKLNAYITLTNCVNDYLIELNRCKGVRSKCEGTLDFCNRKWRTYAAKHNLTANKLSELRVTDFEDYMNDYFLKLEGPKKNGFFKFLGILFSKILRKI